MKFYTNRFSREDILRKNNRAFAPKSAVSGKLLASVSPPLLPENNPMPLLIRDTFALKCPLYHSGNAKTNGKQLSKPRDKIRLGR